MTRSSDAPYTLKQVRQLLGLTPAVVHTLVGSGFVVPSRGPRRELRFTFQDLVLLKTAEGLRRAGVPTKRIVASLERLRDTLPSGVPLTGLRITSSGADVAVRDASGFREATTGQLLLDFEVQIASDMAILVEDRLATSQAPEPDWFDLANALEASDIHKAEDAYRMALAAQPGHLHAIVNLGALLCESGRCFEATVLFDEAICAGAESALLHFNHAIALEDVGEYQRAMEAYLAALSIDPEMVDAHYNLGILLERQGDGKGALRHFSACFRLEQQ